MYYVDKLLVPSIKSRNVKVERLIEKPDEIKTQTCDINKVVISDEGTLVYGIGEDERRMGRNYVEMLSLLFENKVPVCEFEFYSPSVRYRGFHIDTVRFFFPIDELKRIIKAMSLFGFNYFHFHLTDDQGWRFPVEGYERLESVSSHCYRPYNDDNNHSVGGFYSLDDLRDIEEYSRSLGITVIPEIETPGHSEALLAAYPEFGCTGNKIDVQYNYGVFENVMNPASPELWSFLDKAFGTLSSIFSSPYINIGGDECPHKQWKDNKECIALMEREGISNVDDLQGWFTSRVSSLVSSYGKRAIGWDEVVDAPLKDNSVVVMSWRGLEGARKATSRGHSVILCPQTDGCYLDRYPSSDDWEKGNLSICTPKDIFNLDISMKELSEKERALVLGAQCNLWCEKIESGREAELMLFPRAFILAENLWLGERKNWDEIKEKRKALYDLCFYLDIVCSPLKWD